jgi:DnaD/phage-associated family protein
MESDEMKGDKVKKFHDALDDVLDRPIAYNPAFKRITASTVAGIFLSQAWYWSKRHKEDDGWFFKTGEEWEDETGLTRSEQETARKHCLRVGVMEEKRKGIPATMYYRVLKTRVYELLGFHFVEIPQTDQIAGNQQSDNHSNINKVTETPSKIPLNDNDSTAIEERTSLFATLYSNNIGAITPLGADLIRNMAIDYPDSTWYQPAFEIAVKNNARNLNYVDAVLKGWKDHHFGWKPERKNGNGKPKSSTPAPFQIPADELERQRAAVEKRFREKGLIK